MSDKTRKEWMTFLILMSLVCFIAISSGKDASHILSQATFVIITTIIIRAFVTSRDNGQDDGDPELLLHNVIKTLV